MELSAMACREDFNKGSSEVESPFELLSGCQDIIKVFADDSGDRRYNDFTSWLAIDFIWNVEFKLLKDCEEIAILDNDDFGTYYPTGTWAEIDGFSFFQSKYKGYKLEWDRVLATHGVGHYQIQVTYGVGEAIFQTICSCQFQLEVYDRNRADKTIRIRTIQNGTILNSNNYLGMEWEQCWRLQGFFGYPQDKLQLDNYLDKERNLTQIQDKLYKEYTLQTDFLAECHKDIFDDILLSNNIFIDDYNIKNAYELYNIDVLPADSQSNYFIESTDTYKEIVFESRDRQSVKRNVK